jgi:hypothetical protein
MWHGAKNLAKKINAVSLYLKGITVYIVLLLCCDDVAPVLEFLSYQDSTDERPGRTHPVDDGGCQPLLMVL